VIKAAPEGADNLSAAASGVLLTGGGDVLVFPHMAVLVKFFLVPVLLAMLFGRCLQVLGRYSLTMKLHSAYRQAQSLAHW
jgi:hypothetical protein